MVEFVCSVIELNFYFKELSWQGGLETDIGGCIEAPNLPGFSRPRILCWIRLALLKRIDYCVDGAFKDG